MRILYSALRLSASKKQAFKLRAVSQEAVPYDSGFLRRKIST